MQFRKAFLAFWRRPEIPAASRAEYHAFLERHQRRTVVPMLVLATIIMVAFHVVDRFVVTDVATDSLIARVAMVLPVSGAAIVYLTIGPRRLFDFHVVAAAISIYFGTLASIVLTRSSEPLAGLYLSANNITIVFAILMLGLPPLIAAATGVAIIAIQAALLMTASYATGELAWLLTTISLVVASTAFFGNWRMDLDRRHHFLIRRRDKDLVRDLSAQNILLERLSALDPLTGLSNRRGLDVVLGSAVQDLLDRRADGGIGLAMVDVDHFKLFNDTQGHAQGDEALRKVGRALSRAGPECELAARYGGEEFVIIMPGISPYSLEMTGARLRASVERLAIPHPASPTSRVVTVSIGLVYADPHVVRGLGGRAPGERAMISAADAALYRAKANGRNGFVVEQVGEPGTDGADEASPAEASRA